MASSRACVTQFSDITNIDPFQEERLMKNVAVFSLALLLSTAAQAAEYMEKTPFQLSRAFSPGVITPGGTIVWVAGPPKLDCTVKNISETDAMLQAFTTLGIPASFDIVMEGARRHCRSVCRQVFLRRTRGRFHPKSSVRMQRLSWSRFATCEQTRSVTIKARWIIVALLS